MIDSRCSEIARSAGHEMQKNAVYASRGRARCRKSRESWLGDTAKCLETEPITGRKAAKCRKS